MADRWFVRVGEKEYGPVDLDTLGDWKREGRLLPTNEVRRESESDWTRAATIPGLFGPPPLPAATGHPLVRRRTFGEIIQDSFRIYKSAFLPFFVLTLLIAVPTLALELTSPAYGIFSQAGGNGLTRARIIALIAFTALVVAWPILSLVLALLILAVQVIMVARLWVNFLFWQQSAYISNLDGLDALRESKLLARSKRRPRKSTRPLWRGALLVSLWVLIVLGLSA